MSLSLSEEQAIALVLAKQHLAAAAKEGDAIRVAEDLLGLHATGSRSPYLQLRARIPGFTREHLDAALDEGRAAKVPCMRTTLFIEPAAMVPVMLAATRPVRERGRQRYLEASGLTAGRYQRLAERVESAVAGRALDSGQLQLALGMGRSLSPVLVLMCDDARLVRWKGTGGWESARPSYRLFSEALPGVRIGEWEEPVAARELVRWYVGRYGPVTEDDAAWWTGLGTRTVREALASDRELVQVGVGTSTRPYLLHESDLPASPRHHREADPEISLLPVLDPCLQGYHQRERWIEPARVPFVVDRGGNVTSVILVSGKVAGVWDHVEGPVPELRLHLFDRPDPRTRRRLHALATEVGEFLAPGPVAVVEVERMAPLTGRAMGSVLSPLRDPARGDA